MKHKALLGMREAGVSTTPTLHPWSIPWLRVFLFSNLSLWPCRFTALLWWRRLLGSLPPHRQWLRLQWRPEPPRPGPGLPVVAWHSPTDAKRPKRQRPRRPAGTRHEDSVGPGSGPPGPGSKTRYGPLMCRITPRSYPHGLGTQEPRQDGAGRAAAAGLPGKAEAGQAPALRRLQPPPPLVAHAQRDAVAVAVAVWGGLHAAPVPGLWSGPASRGGRAAQTFPRWASGPGSGPCCEPPRGAEEQPPGPKAFTPHLCGALPWGSGEHKALGGFEPAPWRPFQPAQSHPPRNESRESDCIPGFRNTQQHALGRPATGCPLFHRKSLYFLSPSFPHHVPIHFQMVWMLKIHSL